jgi:hypothetical protein
MSEPGEHIPAFGTPTNMVVDSDAFRSAPKFYAQSVGIEITQEEAVLTFSVRQLTQDIGSKDLQDVLFTQGVCYMSVTHFARFVALLNAHMHKYQEDMKARLIAQGVLDEDGKYIAG